ncbi:MAG TPA: oligosaccharide flippase family protein [Parvularculaceae bacterium]|nr:oligosaccharide flippase family protein [Parvularculaceae bacterium]
MIRKHFSGGTLKARALKGGVVALSGFGAAQAIRLASNLVMTRLLAPDAFGLMGVTLALQVWIAMMSDLGLDASIVRSKNGEDPKFLATARLLQLARALLIALLLALIGFALPSLAANGAFRETSVYADPRLPIFLFCLAGAVTIGGFNAMRIALHNRKLDLTPVIRLELGSQIFSVAVMIAAALAGAGVYSLAIGAIAAAASKCVGSFFFLKGPPARFAFDREHFREIFTYGKWLIIASTFGFLVQRGDQLIFGWLLDLDAFSLFSIAAIWIVSARTVIETVQRRVVHPTLAELHRDRPRDLTRNYRRLRLSFEAACLAIFLGVVFFADFMIRILYTDAYQGVAHYLKLLAPMMLMMPYRLLSAVTLTGGDSRRFTWITIVPGLALFIGTPIVYNAYGADAAIVYAVLTPMTAQPFNWKFAAKFVKIDYARESLMMIIAIIAAALLLKFV